jgi:hypothetical protein
MAQITTNVITQIPYSTPVAGTAFKVRNVANVDGSTINTLTLTGMPVGDQNADGTYQNPSGMLIQVLTNPTGDGGGTAKAAYATYDPATLLVNQSNPTVVTVGVYVYAVGTTANCTDLLLFVLP